MQPRKVIFLTLPSGIFGNGGQSWLSIDLQPSQTLLEQRGFDVLYSTIDKVRSLNLCRDDIVIYTSCEAPEIREYMKDTFYFLRHKCHLIPEYDFLLSYENKGFQELKKQDLGIGNLRGDYNYDIDTCEYAFPYVFKTITGAGSSGVRLVRTKDDVSCIRRGLFSVSLKRRLITLLRRLKLRDAEYKAYLYRHKGFFRHIVQQFIPNMTHDYKILIFGERYFVLKRYVRKGDFRASGSGRFDFAASTPLNVLAFAKEVATHLDAPQLSLDVADSGEACHLIEYQALNFGPITLTRSKGHYRNEENDWLWIDGPSDLDDCFAHSLGVYFDKHGVCATS